MRSRLPAALAVLFCLLAPATAHADPLDGVAAAFKWLVIAALVVLLVVLLLSVVIFKGLRRTSRDATRPLDEESSDDGGD